VLDLDHGGSSVIGDPHFIAIAGDRATGPSADRRPARGRDGHVGKHFPGHGFVRADSHHEVPVDELRSRRLRPTTSCVCAADRGGPRRGDAGALIYRGRRQPAGYSSVWLRTSARRLGFDGMIFSDDSAWPARTGRGHACARQARDQRRPATWCWCATIWGCDLRSSAGPCGRRRTGSSGGPDAGGKAMNVNGEDRQRMDRAQRQPICLRPPAGRGPKVRRCRRHERADEHSGRASLPIPTLLRGRWEFVSRTRIEEKDPPCSIQR